MSQLTDLLKEIDSLKNQLDQLRPLKKEDEERLWKKFRLEWNYNSNHIEGNTLTYIQTELLLMFDKTTGDHEMREYEEMKAHDVAINLVRAYANDLSRELTEADIREFNKIILVRPFWGNAQTEDGQPTRKLIQPGEYKKEPNSVKLQNGEMFHYASPEETPAKMNELMAWYRKVSSEGKLHPAQIAAQLHYDFVRIHPFDDSNGRTSRLLMNYVLLRNGFPPVIIKTSDKKGYLTALNKADVGDLESFVIYVIDQLQWSLTLNLKAARGESVEEVGDIYKEIELYKKEVKENLEVSVKSLESVIIIVSNSIVPLFGFLNRAHLKLMDFFLFNRVTVSIDGRQFPFELIEGENDAFDFLSEVKSHMSASKVFKKDGINIISIVFDHSNLKTRPNQDIHLNSSISIQFYPLRYEVNYAKQTIAKDYSHSLTLDEVGKISESSIKKIFDRLKEF